MGDMFGNFEMYTIRGAADLNALGYMRPLRPFQNDPPVCVFPIQVGSEGGICGAALYF